MLLPATVSAVVVLVLGCWRWLRGARAAAPLAIAVGFLAGFGALLGVPRVPPLDATNWLYYAAALTGIVAGLDAMLLQPLEESDAIRRPLAVVARLLLVLACSLLMVWLLTRPLLVYAWTGWHGPAWIGSIAIVITCVWIGLDQLSTRVSQVSLAIGLTAASALSGVVIAMSGSLKLAQIAGVLTSAIGAGAALGSLLPKSAAAGRGCVMLFAVLYVGLIASASDHLYATMTSINAFMLLVAPLSGWISVIVPARYKRLRAFAVIAAITLPALLAAILARIEFVRASSDYLDYEY